MKQNMVKSKWTLLARLVRDEHSLWSREGDDRVFIADCSGSTPEHTDDGPLALETELTLTKGYSRAITACVGVVREDGTKMHTMLHPKVAEWLVVNRGFTVKLGRELADCEGLLRAALPARQCRDHDDPSCNMCTTEGQA